MKNILFASLLFISPMVIQPGFSADTSHLRDDDSFTFSSKFSTAFRMHMERTIERRIQNGELTTQDEINALKESMDRKYLPFAEKKMDDNCRNFLTKYFSRNTISVNSHRTNLLGKIFPILFYAGDFGDSHDPNLQSIKNFFHKNTAKKIKQREKPVTMNDDCRNKIRLGCRESMLTYLKDLSPEEKMKRSQKKSEAQKKRWAKLTPEDRARLKEVDSFVNQVRKQEKKDEAERNRVASLPLSHIPQGQRIEAAHRVSERSAAAVREAIREQEEVIGQIGKRHPNSRQVVAPAPKRKLHEERALGEVPEDHDGAHHVPQSQNTERTSFRARAPRDVSPPPRVESASIFDMSDKQRQKIAERLRKKNEIAIQQARQAQQKKPAKKG